MTSQLNVDTIVNKAGDGGVSLTQSPALTTPSLTGMSNTSTYTSDGGAVTQNVVQGLAKVWIQSAANGTSITDSLNVSSLGDDSAGIQTVNINNDMSNGNYAVGVSTGSAGTYSLAIANVSTGSYKGYVYSGHTSDYADVNQKHVLTGDLA